MTFRELFEVGSCFETFLNKDQDSNKEKAVEIYKSITLDIGNIKRITGMGKNI